jgi:hypothetical protein
MLLQSDLQGTSEDDTEALLSSEGLDLEQHIEQTDDQMGSQFGAVAETIDRSSAMTGEEEYKDRELGAAQGNEIGADGRKGYDQEHGYVEAVVSHRSLRQDFFSATEEAEHQGLDNTDTFSSEQAMERGLTAESRRRRPPNIDVGPDMSEPTQHAGRGDTASSGWHMQTGYALDAGNSSVAAGAGGSDASERSAWIPVQPAASPADGGGAMGEPPQVRRGSHQGVVLSPTSPGAEHARFAQIDGARWWSEGSPGGGDALTPEPRARGDGPSAVVDPLRSQRQPAKVVRWWSGEEPLPPSGVAWPRLRRRRSAGSSTPGPKDEPVSPLQSSPEDVAARLDASIQSDCRGSPPSPLNASPPVAPARTALSADARVRGMSRVRKAARRIPILRRLGSVKSRAVPAFIFRVVEPDGVQYRSRPDFDARVFRRRWWDTDEEARGPDCG